MHADAMPRFLQNLKMRGMCNYSREKDKKLLIIDMFLKKQNIMHITIMPKFFQSLQVWGICNHKGDFFFLNNYVSDDDDEVMLNVLRCRLTY